MNRREETIRLWFDEWNTRGTVLQWDIKQYFHKENQTIVEWYFKNTMNNGKVEAFDGISLIECGSDFSIEHIHLPCHTKSSRKTMNWLSCCFLSSSCPLSFSQYTVDWKLVYYQGNHNANRSIQNPCSPK